MRKGPEELRPPQPPPPNHKSDNVATPDLIIGFMLGLLAEKEVSIKVELKNKEHGR